MQFHDPALAEQHSAVLGSLIDEMRNFEWREVPCVVCGEQPDPEPTCEKWGIALSRCQNCDHLFVNPRMPDEAVAAFYSSTYWEQYALAQGCPTLEQRIHFDLDNGLGKLRRDVLPFRTGGRLLDVGASSGGVVRRALDLGFDACGLEPAEEICELARRTHGVKMICGALSSVDLPDASFDVVTMHDVLEHLLDPPRDLRALRRMMAPKALLVVETLSSASLELREMGIDWPLLSPLEHPHYFSERNGARILSESGFRLLDLYSPHENNWIAIAEAA